MTVIGYMGLLGSMWVGWIGIGMFRKAETDPDLDSSRYPWWSRIVIQSVGVSILAVAAILMWACLQVIA